MDLTVPGGMGGKETVGKIREMDPGAKVVVSSDIQTILSWRITGTTAFAA